MSGYLKEPLTYTKPLTLNERLLIEVLTTRYEGVGAAFLAFDRGDHIEVMVPKTIRRAVPWRKEASV